MPSRLNSVTPFGGVGGGGGKAVCISDFVSNVLFVSVPTLSLQKHAQVGLKFTFALGPKMSATGRVFICVPSFLTASSHSFLVASVMEAQSLSSRSEGNFCALFRETLGLHRGGARSIPGQSLRELWRTKWQWERFFSQ